MGADNSSLDNRSVTLRVPIDRGEKVMARLIPVVFNSCAGRLDIPKEKSPESLFNSFAVISVVRFFPLMYISLSFRSLLLLRSESYKSCWNTYPILFCWDGHHFF